MKPRIAILGDFNPTYSTHRALDDVLDQVIRFTNYSVEFQWIPTDDPYLLPTLMKLYSGLWIAPGSPYKNDNNVLRNIRFARENQMPAFGNCGGFQYMLIEFARNVCGIKGADHEETNPGATELLISKLSCSLVEQEESLTITEKKSILFKAVGQELVLGKYYCRYGLNPRYVDILSDSGITVTARSEDGQPRAFELKGHPFFVGTLFQPALTSSVDKPDPMIMEFVTHVLKNNRKRD